MIVVTGAAGFIGSNLVKKLNESGHTDLILVDDFSPKEKSKNLENIQYLQKISIEDFINWFEENGKNVESVFHMGANADTTETDPLIFEKYNLGYTKSIWKICTKFSISLVYASSAATYGKGESGYSDSHEIVTKLKPLNLYGKSKNDFDKWAIVQTKTPPKWAGLKFFNVYGPNEYYKKRMASVVLGAFNQIQQSGKVKLFKSHNLKYKDGEQLRDFVYVNDVIEVCVETIEGNIPSGLYNVGTGKARTFYDLVVNVFKALDLEPNIEFIDTPLDIRDKYQYFTEADMHKLVEAEYKKRSSRVLKMV